MTVLNVLLATGLYLAAGFTVVSGVPSDMKVGRFVRFAAVAAVAASAAGGRTAELAVLALLSAPYLLVLSSVPWMMLHESLDLARQRRAVQKRRSD